MCLLFYNDMDLLLVVMKLLKGQQNARLYFVSIRFLKLKCQDLLLGLLAEVMRQG